MLKLLLFLGTTIMAVNYGYLHFTNFNDMHYHILFNMWLTCVTIVCVIMSKK
jgi:hypothetical protein